MTKTATYLTHTTRHGPVVVAGPVGTFVPALTPTGKPAGHHVLAADIAEAFNLYPDTAYQITEGDCSECGKRFQRTAEGWNATTCSDDCRNARAKRVKRERMAATRPSRAKPPVTKSCAQCGADFEARRSTATYCSTKCRVAAHRL